MKLKLAEYEEGNFKGFLELGEEFGYYGNKIHFVGTNSCNWSWNGSDRKDPLNRFNGLFDGRTYGEGRFVLIQDDEDDIKTVCNLPVAPFYDPLSVNQKYELKDVIFNLHENPELWDKIK